MRTIQLLSELVKQWKKTIHCWYYYLTLRFKKNAGTHAITLKNYCNVYTCLEIIEWPSDFEWVKMRHLMCLCQLCTKWSCLIIKQELYLRNNNLENLPPDIFQNTPLLSQLALSGNLLRTLDGNTFAHMPGKTSTRLPFSLVRQKSWLKKVMRSVQNNTKNNFCI